MLLAVAGYPIPNLTNVRDYADLLQEKLVGKSEQAGRQNEARSYYWTVAHFGERVQLGSATEIERLIAAGLQAKAYERLLPLLRRLGESDEAATVEFASQQARRPMTADRAPGSTHLERESRPASSSFWTARMTRLFMKLAVLFASFNLLCLVYVGAKRWAHGQKEGWLGRFLTRGLDYAPILLFFAAAGCTNITAATAAAPMAMMVERMTSSCSPPEPRQRFNRRKRRRLPPAISGRSACVTDAPHASAHRGRSMTVTKFRLVPPRPRHLHKGRARGCGSIGACAE